MPNRVALVVSSLLMGAFGATALLGCVSTPPAGPAHDHAAHDHAHFEGGGELSTQAQVSFRQEITPILRAHCGACHGVGGPGATALTMFEADGTARHATIRDRAGAILLEIQTGRMPLGKPDSVPEDQFRALDVWAASGGPDN